MWNYPDDLFIGLEFNMTSRSLVRMCVGHYSEVRPDVNLFDRNQREQKYWQIGDVLIVAFQNCIKSRKDFSEFVKLLQDKQLSIDLPSVFIEVYKICSIYTSINEFRRISYNAHSQFNVHPHVFRRALRVKFDLGERGKEFNVKFKWKRTESCQFPIEFGGFLQQVRASYGVISN